MSADSHASPAAPAAADPSVAPAASSTDSSVRDYALLRWLTACTFIVILNETIVVNALPRLMVELDITARTAQWLTSAFMLTMAVVIPATGWFLQRVTTRQALASAMTAFLLGTLICAIAPGFTVLLIGRIIQAAGTAVMVPLLMTTVMTIVREEDRGRIMGNVTLAISVAPALGPAVSGLVLEVASWRWMFGVVLPIAGVITAVSLRRMISVGTPVAGTIDLLSVALSVLGFGPLVYGLSQLGAPGQSAAIPVASVVVGLLGVAGFIWRQKALERSADAVPLLDLRTVLIRTYALGLSLMTVSFMAMLGAMILLPLYLQETRGLSELKTGLLVMPGGLIMGLLGPQVGKVYDRVGARVLIVPGSVGVLIGLVLLTQLSLTTPFAFVLTAHVLLMASLAAVFTPVFTISLGSLPPHLYSHGSSLLGALQQVGAAAGTAALVAVMSARAISLSADGVGADQAQVSGMTWAFMVAAAMAAVVIVIGLFIPNREPGASTHH